MQKAAALTILFSAAVSILLNLKIPFSYLSSLFLLKKNFSSFFIQDQFRVFPVFLIS